MHLTSNSLNSNFPLPPEIVNYILDFVPPNLLATTALVCKVWAELSLNELRWKMIGQKKEWVNLDQSWRACAKREAIERGFFKRECYTLKPKFSLVEFKNKGKDVEKREACEDLWSRLNCKKYYVKPVFRTSAPEICELKTDEHVQTLFHPSPLLTATTFDSYLVTADIHHNIRIWDIAKGSCLHTISSPEELKGDDNLTLSETAASLSPYTFAFCENVLVALRLKRFQLRESVMSVAAVFYLSEPERNFSFLLEGQKTCALLQQETLVVNLCQGKNTLSLINLREKNFYTLHVPLLSAEVDTLKNDKMVWEGRTLLYFRSVKSFQTTVFQMELWDFLVSEKTPEPLQNLIVLGRRS